MEAFQIDFLLKSKYLKGKAFSQYDRKKGCSYTWRNVLKGKELVNKGKNLLAQGLKWRYEVARPQSSSQVEECNRSTERSRCREEGIGMTFDQIQKEHLRIHYSLLLQPWPIS